jgi:hypothetical protein
MNSTQDTISKKKKTITKKGLVEWLKVQALSSNPSTSKKWSMAGRGKGEEQDEEEEEKGKEK